jgi:hypothetical protein
LIITGLIVVENDHSAFQTGGLLLTVSGVAILVVTLRGAFDLELHGLDLCPAGEHQRQQVKRLPLVITETFQALDQRASLAYRRA